MDGCQCKKIKKKKTLWYKSLHSPMIFWIHCGFCLHSIEYQAFFSIQMRKKISFLLKPYWHYCTDLMLTHFSLQHYYSLNDQCRCLCSKIRLSGRKRIYIVVHSCTYITQLKLNRIWMNEWMKERTNKQNLNSSF